MKKDYICVSIDGCDCSGKQQPISEPVLTPDGWKPIGSLKVGSQVIGSKGVPVNVIAIHPQIDKRVFSVHFKDGTKVRCGADHLWKVYTLKQRTRNYSHNKDNHFIKTTQELLIELETSRPKNSYGYKFAIPQYKPVIEGIKFRHAYALGYMLGNGCFSKSQLAISCNVNVKNKLKELLSENLGLPTNEGHTSENGIQLAYKWLELPEELSCYRNTGLSHEKDILQDWTTWDLESKKNLLSGLLDSDGSTTENSVYFCSTNINLIKLVQTLTRNIGQTAYQILQNDKREYYKSGACFNISLRFDYNPFKLRCWTPRTDRKYLPLITKIEQENYKEESICIELDSEDKLYTTTDYKLTHNSSAIVKIKKQLELDGYDVVIFKDFTENYPNKYYKSLITEIREFVLNTNNNYATLPKTINPLLFTVARLKMIEDIKRFINNRYNKNPLVIILDRYVHSTLAYQVSLGCDINLTEYLCYHACTLLKPNLSVLLDINYLTYIERINKRKSKFIDNTESQLIKEDIFDDIKMNFIVNFKNSYLKYADKHLIIDNNVFSDKNTDLIISQIKSIF